MTGDSTRCVKAVAAEGSPGSPMQQGPVFAAPYLLGEDETGEVDTYARASNPGWRALEAALATLEGAVARAVVGSGMSAVTVALRACSPSRRDRRRARRRLLPGACLRAGLPRRPRCNGS